MRALVTGAAGFIGSNLADRLLAEGWEVRGVDRFTAYYEEAMKRRNLDVALRSARFELVEADLLTCELSPLLDGIDVVFHQAAQPGVRLSWADGFRLYNDLNVNVTQRLLEAVRNRPVERFVYASSSSIYGNAPTYPTPETAETAPHSPYGVTKLAGELLCTAYGANFGVPTVSLRYFTVYGERQRPDMAIHRMIEAARRGATFELFGDGSHVRDFTYVGDVVDANLCASRADVRPGSVFNVAGGDSTSMKNLVELIENAVGVPLRIDWLEERPGDVQRTGGDISAAAASLGWTPRTGLAAGIGRQFTWHRQVIPSAGESISGLRP